MSEQNKEIKLNVNEVGKELIIRHGKAVPAKQPRESVKVYGTLGVIKERLSKLPNEVTEETEHFKDSKFSNSYISVDRELGKIELIEDAGMKDANKFVGQLTVDPRFEKFGINSRKEYTTHELADFIKMNRSFFETKSTAMKLITKLRKFKAKVDKDIENEDNRRGDRRILIAQVVDSNIPESFKLDIPIFKGQPRQKIEVEIAIDSGDFSCKLISPQAADFIEEIKDELIDEELIAIQEMWPDLQIYEV